MICKYLLPFSRLPFHFVDGFIIPFYLRSPILFPSLIANHFDLFNGYYFVSCVIVKCIVILYSCLFNLYKWCYVVALILFLPLFPRHGFWDLPCCCMHTQSVCYTGLQGGHLCPAPISSNGHPDCTSYLLQQTTPQWISSYMPLMNLGGNHWVIGYIDIHHD